MIQKALIPKKTESVKTQVANKKSPLSNNVQIDFEYELLQKIPNNDSNPEEKIYRHPC